MSRPGDWVCFAISAATMKMPEPIIEPITSVVASSRPRPFTKRLAMRVYCTLPVRNAGADGGGGAVGGEEIGYHSDRIGAGVEHGVHVLARDASDRYQGLRCQESKGAQGFDSHHRVGVELRLRSEHRADGEV